jgi:hypothetical protein
VFVKDLKKNLLAGLVACVRRTAAHTKPSKRVEVIEF